MPIVQIHLLEGRSVDLKRQLISEVTDVVSSTLGNPSESIRVLIHEVSEENWGVAGTTMMDRKANK